jgi:lambda family phage tail tape measure protein
MADAVVEFARTGKLNFKDLINNMIADLVRFELRQMASSMYKSASPGLMNFGGMMGSFGDTIANLVGGYTGGTTGSALVGLAQGAAYDMGIKKFAMGGSFANSIVDSPTLFKFASGTGLMGEAGPEAIMPLKRDAQGNLGVRSGNNGGNVEVVVNNYGSEKATTTESTDSRGNRKVEVIIGDLSAGEISRNGSNSQRSLKNTFGLQPALIRR